tara:strand:- start:101 stop:2692 length:2592 start_codon:yes stop_codon:yes gene_type:complete
MSLFEGTNVNLKGWIHGKKRKIILWKPKSHIRPYHTEHVVNNPKKYGMTEHDLLKIIAKGMDGFEPEDDETKDLLQDVKVGRFDRDDQIDEYMYSQGWVRVVLNKGTSSIEAPRAYNRNILPAAKVLAKRFAWEQIEFLEMGDILHDDVPQLISDEGSWKTYLKTGKVPKKTEIGSTMAMFREWMQFNEGKFGHTLWIDPKGKIYDMNDRKEITHPKGHPYTHYDWVAANFTKYFGKTAPDNMGKVVYDAPHEKGWARVRNNSREIDVEVNMKKLTRSQKKALRDIVDAGPEYGNKGINRPMYIDAWVKNKKSRAGDKSYNNYEEIVDFLSEEVLDEGVRDIIMKLRRMPAVIKKIKSTAQFELKKAASTLLAIPAVSSLLSSSDKQQQAVTVVRSLRSMILGEEINECWSTHVQRGYKMKGGKRVPNCVPKNEDIQERRSDVFCIVDPKGKVVASNLTSKNAEKEVSRHRKAIIVLDPDAKTGDKLPYFATEEVDEVYRDSGLGKWFHGQSAGGEPGWDRYNTKGEKIGKCGDKKPGEGKPKCLSRQKAAKLRAQGGKKAIGNAVRRKRAADPDTDRPGTGNKPINVSNKIKKEETMKSFNQYLQEKNKPTNPKLWAASIAAAKRKFDVYPSAYANAWASKHYKSKGGSWTKSESVEEGVPKSMDQGDALKVYNKLKKGSKVTVQFGGAMSSTKEPLELVVSSPHRIVGKSKVGRIILKNPSNMRGMKYTLYNRDGKISLAQGDMATIMTDLRIMKESNELDEGCGCNGTSEEAKSPAWTRKAGKNKEGGLNAAGRRSYERENPGSDLKAPVSAKTAKKNPDGKAAKRRKSFCARMGGMPGPMKDEKGRPTRKALALRKWDC